MHGHVVVWGMEEVLMPLNIANGITGFREMWGVTTELKRVREAVRAGTMVGPRFVFAGNIVDGWPPTRPGEVVVRTPEEGRHAVDSLVEAGAEFIKVYSLLDSASFTAIAERGRERGIPIAGHVPMSVSASYAAAQGQHSTEHLEGVMVGCSREESAIVARRQGWLRDRQRDSAAASPLMGEIRNVQSTILASFDVQRCDRLLRSLAARGMYQVPTMAVLRGISHLGDPAVVVAARTRYLPPAVRDMWDMIGRDTTFTRDSSSFRVYNRLEQRVVGRIAALGVPVLAGTDSPNPNTYPAFGLHDELELLVGAGFSPLNALRAATINPARYFAATDTMGTIAIGKVADIVLLGGNPLRNIRNTRAIRTVIANGRLFDRAALDGLLEAAAAKASAPPPTPH